MFSKIIVCPHK